MLFQGQPVDTFLGSLLADSTKSNSVRILQHPLTCKDYVYISDVAELLFLITSSGKHRIYNLASGINISHENISELLSSYVIKLFFDTFETKEYPKSPTICVDRIRSEFFSPALYPFQLYDLI